MVRRFSRYRSVLMGLAIVWVIVFHTYTHMDVPLLSWASSYGYLGVEVFLFLSGFGLYVSLYRNCDVCHFYQRRLSRVVFPWLMISLPYWIAKTILADHEGMLQFILNWLGVSFWMQGVTSVWYVSLITVLYALYPLLFRIQRTREWAIIVVLVIYDLTLFGMVLLAPRLFLMLEIALTRIPAFLLGSFAGPIIVSKESNDKDSQRRSLTLYRYAVICCLMYIMAALVCKHDYPLGRMALRFGGFGIAFCVMSVFVLLIDYFETSILTWILSSLGGVSLELYLIHVFLGNISSRLNLLESFSLPTKLVLSILRILVAIVLSFAANRFFIKMNRQIGETGDSNFFSELDGNNEIL